MMEDEALCTEKPIVMEVRAEKEVPYIKTQKHKAREELEVMVTTPQGNSSIDIHSHYLNLGTDSIVLGGAGAVTAYP
jgi:hypothetical protein